MVRGLLLFRERREGLLPPQVWGGIECIGLFSIVLLHELGHAPALPPKPAGKAPTVPGRGGVACVFLRRGPAPSSGASLPGRLSMSFSSPSHGFYFWGIHQPWAEQAPDLLICAGNLAGLNLGLLIFNMMPVYPLDGGQILQSLLWFVIGRAYSLLVVSATGFLVAVLSVVAVFQ